MTEETELREKIERSEREVLEQTMLFSLCFFLEKPWQVLLWKRPTLAILEKDETKPWWHVMVDARPSIPHQYTFNVTLDEQGEFLFTPQGFWLEGINQVRDNQTPQEEEKGRRHTEEKRQARQCKVE